MNRYLFFDTETNGLPKSWKAPHSDTANWPQPVSIAYAEFDQDGKPISERYAILRRDDLNELTWDMGAQKVHGITYKQSMAEGEDRRQVMTDFLSDAAIAHKIIAHNIKYDIAITVAEFWRVFGQYNDPFLKEKQFCTMFSTTNICKLPHANGRRGGYKWPKLEELYRFLFQEEMVGAHNALDDIKATAKCFFELRRRQLIPQI